jgi:hypothetical protein
MKSVEKNLRERSAKELAQIAQATQGVIGDGPAPAAIMLDTNQHFRLSPNAVHLCIDMQRPFGP